MKYSNVVCFGDSFTNEIQCYEENGVMQLLNERQYEFKSYPQLLGEHYNCPWETYGKPGLTLPFVVMELIDKIDYILSLENPLVIFQFGFFFNATLKRGDGTIFWKDLGGSTNNDGVVNSNDELIDSLSEMDRLSILHWFENFEEHRNYWYIEEFKTICKLVNRLKQQPVDMYGLFMHEQKFDIPRSKELFYLNTNGHAFSDLGLQRINDVFPDIHDSHKSTHGNIVLVEKIVEHINAKKKDEQISKF